MYGDNCFYCMGRGTGGAWSKLASLMANGPLQLNVFLCSLLSLQNIEIVFWVAKCQMSYGRIRSHQTHNNPILHDFTSSASSISENSNKDCDNHELIIKVSTTNIQCLTHISLIVLALAVYLALELSAESKWNILGAFSYRKENVFSRVKQNSIQRAGFQMQSSVRKLLYFLSTLLSCLTSIHCLPTVARWGDIFSAMTFKQISFLTYNENWQIYHWNSNCW